ncbi:hypothetical protein EJ04DRAFT_510255 [Polyplosphaeria fusca]|uniref:Uncharacterized protein n=1 Tax=Polyplosphaeria fusca TaxID=682080 RepID=A0A9P4R6A5_9PLEO|nr:hypothetical protein EJ04DRAFT_510255 [Polyplosphaeria fusca]
MSSDDIEGKEATRLWKALHCPVSRPCRDATNPTIYADWYDRFCKKRGRVSKVRLFAQG